MKLVNEQWAFKVPEREFYLLATPMTGRPGLNLPLVRFWSAALGLSGIVAYNPFQRHHHEALTKQEADYFTSQYMPLVTHPRCAGVIALPGWDESDGATTEIILAERFHKPQFSIDLEFDEDGRIHTGLKPLEREAICV